MGGWELRRWSLRGGVSGRGGGQTRRKKRNKLQLRGWLTCGELGVGPGLAVDLDQPLLHDGLHLLHRYGVLQTVP